MYVFAGQMTKIILEELGKIWETIQVSRGGTDNPHNPPEDFIIKGKKRQAEDQPPDSLNNKT